MTNRLHFANVAALLAALPLVGCGVAAPDASPACSGEYASQPEGTSGAVYVSAACGAQDGDGSKERPFATIQQGIDASAEGGAVLVDAGTYEENLSITKAVQVLGVDETEDPNRASIIVQAPSPYAINVEGAAGVVLRGIIVQKPQGAGIWVQKKGGATILASRIEGAIAAKTDGHGVMATDEGSIIVQRTIIVQSEGAGVHVDAAGAKVERSIIVQNGAFAGIWVQRAMDQVSLVDNEISENTDAGITILGSRAIIVQNEVKHTRARSAGGQADGIRIVSDAELGEAYFTIGDSNPESANVIEGNDRVGIFVSGELARGLILHNQVIGNADATKRGAGIWLQSGAGSVEAVPDAAPGIVIQQNRIENNHFLGIGVTSNARALLWENPSISGTIAEEVTVDGQAAKIGDGLGVYAGASAQVEFNTFSGNARAAALFDGAAASSFTKNTFEKTAEHAIIVQNSAGPISLGDNKDDLNPMPVAPVLSDPSNL
ncbi:right-handed parallel beta-helix repeat-containing protein [Polyangium spumosum]|uniref:DUF1565 domain-containing protein n=1 Tax=Polyangium spumosum TaxID=889282 RepID=A0A6N7PMK8_9BACT|nr:right-handed parallel beta-helix repeat-containing protein [Polyangium spumosum]MRG91510.1 DUF1565 domain-containing protein [Polyangium spumosum]